MLTSYVVLDGFDFGAGALHLFVARNDAERRQVLAAIGPFWDGNEVWLIATGGALMVAFPRVLASGLSGFYFAIFLVLWLFSFAASRSSSGVISMGLCGGRPGTFCSASPAGNAGALWRRPRQPGAGAPDRREGGSRCRSSRTSAPRPPVGILDWYTIVAGLFAGVVIAAHGATFLAWKTDGEVSARSRRAAVALYVVVACLWPVVTAVTSLVNPDLFAAIPARPLAWISVMVAFGGLACVVVGLRQSPLLAFLRIERVSLRAARGDRGLHLSGHVESPRRRQPIADGLQRERAGIQPENRNAVVGCRLPAGDSLFRSAVSPPSRQGGRCLRGGRLLMLPHDPGQQRATVTTLAVVTFVLGSWRWHAARPHGISGHPHWQPAGRCGIHRGAACAPPIDRGGATPGHLGAIISMAIALFLINAPFVAAQALRL